VAVYQIGRPLLVTYAADFEGKEGSDPFINTFHINVKFHTNAVKACVMRRSSSANE